MSAAGIRRVALPMSADKRSTPDRVTLFLSIRNPAFRCDIHAHREVLRSGSRRGLVQSEKDRVTGGVCCGRWREPMSTVDVSTCVLSLASGTNCGVSQAGVKSFGSEVFIEKIGVFTTVRAKSAG